MKVTCTLASVTLALAWGGLACAQAHKSASFFMDGTRNPTLLAAIRKGTDAKITFNRRFSSAFVACGTGCGSNWFVDRATGGVVEVPGSRASDQMIWDVRAQPSSDVAAVIYGPSDGTRENCFVRRFRLVGKAFVALDRPARVRCPA